MTDHVSSLQQDGVQYGCKRCLLVSCISSISSSSNFLPTVFFYGTLCVPAVLAKVLGHKCENITFQDALLPVSFVSNWRRVTDERSIGLHQAQSQE